MQRLAFWRWSLPVQVGAAIGLGAAFGFLLREAPADRLGSVLAVLGVVADLFLLLLKMLIVPLVFTSIVSGVASLGTTRELGRLGGKTIAFYVASSLLAAILGLVLVDLVRPGDGARLAIDPPSDDALAADGFVDLLVRAVPENPVAALADNGRILQVIVFAILLGVFIARTGGESGPLLGRVFRAGFEVMTRMASAILLLVPYGVFVLIVRATASNTLEFEALLRFALTVLAGLTFHAIITLPLLLWAIARVSPLAWARAVVPALTTAFSTASSAATLPVTMRSVSERGGVSERTTSFVLPLGATINMDGTALYECVGVVFLAQYYASIGEFELTTGVQVTVVLAALLASVGAAGIPRAGLVMMTTILSALGLPAEGALLLLTIDPPLDMVRTAVNVWSDTVCAAIVARSEGESLLGTDGPPENREGPENR